jgi:hypothetical protein
MPSALPFSEVDHYLASIPNDIGCLVDTSFLIAVNDTENSFHEDAIFLQERLADRGVRLFVSVTARSEFIDYHRRVIVTETLMDMLAPSSKWKISTAVRDVLQKQKGWIDNQSRSENEPYFTDYRIKVCKQAFLPRTQSGKIGWTEFCREYLSGRLLTAWTGISEALQLQYVDMRDGGSKDLLRKNLRWEDMYRLAEESALGSQDAMILNLLDASIFPFLVTMDFDLAYGVMLSAPDKTALVPDNLYRNRIKKLRL